MTTSAPSPLLRVEGLQRHYEHRGFLGRGHFVTRAVDGVSFALAPGETMGLVGESGSGKSTTGRLIMRLEDPTAGRIWFDDRDITQLSEAEMKPLRRKIQIVFQDPYAALNPRMRVGDFVAEPLLVHRSYPNRAGRDEKVAELFNIVGLDPRFTDRYPHEFSGGQRQRICIARAIALEPDLIVADEPITALDVSIQAQIVNLFRDLQERLGVAYLFIAHDLSMVRFLCTRVAVMLRGRIVEMGNTEEIFSNPLHAYTRSLLSSVPIPNPALERARHRITFDPNTLDLSSPSSLTEVSPDHWVQQ